MQQALRLIDWYSYAAAACVVALGLAILYWIALLETRDNGCDDSGCDDWHFLRGRQLAGTEPQEGDDVPTLVRRMRNAAAHVPRGAIWRRSLIAAIPAAILSLVVTAYAPLPVRMVGMVLSNFLFFYGLQNYYNFHVGRLAGTNAVRAEREILRKLSDAEDSVRQQQEDDAEGNQAPGLKETGGEARRRRSPREVASEIDWLDD